jgi:hypothetical protein
MMRPSEEFLRAEIAYRESLFGLNHLGDAEPPRRRHHWPRRRHRWASLRPRRTALPASPSPATASPAIDVTPSAGSGAGVIRELRSRARRPGAAA